jgi:hypothetical protein
MSRTMLALAIVLAEPMTSMSGVPPTPLIDARSIRPPLYDRQWVMAEPEWGRGSGGKPASTPRGNA